jgi:RNase adapter protein RapZ
VKLVVVTGLSGSGKSIALHTLEDLGYNCIDNLPVFLLQELARRLMAERDPAFERTAVGIDARNAPQRLQALPPLVRELKAQGIECQIIFLDAQADTLSKRYSETRRKHPLAGGERSLEEAMRLERQLLDPIFSCADLHVDTTHTNVHQLRDLIRERVGTSGARVSILLMSFGFKHGVPRDADFVFDVRCVPNPHWQPQLRPLTGRDREVIQFLETSPGVGDMLADLHRFLDRWIPAFEADGRSYLTITLGCTGGQHRSVYMTEELGRHLAALGRAVLVRHRELSP